MDQEKNTEVADTFLDADEGESVSVDDFIKQLEEKEKDLHITVETSIIEIEASFDDHDEPAFLVKPPVTAIPHVAPPLAVAAPSPRMDPHVAELKATIAKMEADREEIFKNSQRRTKDFEAFKSRAERERKDTFQNQIGNVAMLMLPALDNLHRALEAAGSVPDGKSDTFEQFYEGIALVSEQINEILNKMGIRPIRTVGEEFDPHFHEAVATEETDAYPANTICGEILRGYIAGERVIRHSLVKVAKSAQSQKNAVEEASETEADIFFDADSQPE